MTTDLQEEHDLLHSQDLTARKRALRHSAFRRRKAISQDQLTDAGRALQEYAMRYIRALSPGATLAAYISMGHEIPTLPTLDHWHSLEFTVLVPRLGSGRDIGWSRYTGSSNLLTLPRTASGGLRPGEPGGEILGPESLAMAQVILVPALAVDSRHIRLGRGAGWYDRALSYRSDTARVIAVCWPWELIDGPLPADAHDVPVDEVIRLDQCASFT